MLAEQTTLLHSICFLQQSIIYTPHGGILRLAGLMSRRMGGLMGTWMNGWMDGWMDRWMDGRMDGWMDG